MISTQEDALNILMKEGGEKNKFSSPDSNMCINVEAEITSGMLANAGP